MSQVILRFEQSLDTYESESLSHPVVFDSLQSHGEYLTRLLCSWNSPGKRNWSG